MGGYGARSMDFRTLTSEELERGLGKLAGKVFYTTGSRQWCFWGTVELNDGGEPYIASEEGRSIILKHGDVVRLKCRGRGFNSVRDYSYVEN